MGRCRWGGLAGGSLPLRAYLESKDLRYPLPDATLLEASALVPDVSCQLAAPATISAALAPHHRF